MSRSTRLAFVLVAVGASPSCGGDAPGRVDAMAADGAATIPAAAMSNLAGGGFSRVTVQAWRDLVRTATVVDGDGQRVEVALVTRHAKIGRFDTSE